MGASKSKAERDRLNRVDDLAKRFAEEYDDFDSMFKAFKRGYNQALKDYKKVILNIKEPESHCESPF